MRSIKRLPEAVHGSVRSGIILFDFTRVVEELIFNSLDAGASKVSVAVAVGTCYIKVVDDGSGITRDALSLLGERYATSKDDQSADMASVSGSFGFRGEALSSISDISLLEFVTKAHGRPNGYRKVIKACQCLYLGIDDGRQDAGTTVIVRDLFYNQPVRRKHMQSSPRKVLHSVKKCVLRIALMHPKVSFKVVDIESEDELLHTAASPSPLSLLTSSFGFEFSDSLHLLNVSDGVLKIYGYISGPCSTFSAKAFHYVYINSRYICKGPIHRLLNELAFRFNSTVMWKANIGSQNRKQSRSQPYASYILNLACPRSCYDLTFEPSKTSVEFKDWAPILTFIEKAITNFWSENRSHENDIMQKEGDNFVSVEGASDETAKKRRRIQNNEACSGVVSPPLLGMLIEESDHRCNGKNNRLSFHKSHRNVVEFKEKLSGFSYLKSCQNASEFEKHQTGVPICQSESPSLSCSESVDQYGMTFYRDRNYHLWTSHDKIIYSEDNFLGNKFSNTEKSNEHADNILSSTWGGTYRDIGVNMDDELKQSELSCEGFKINYDVDEFSSDLKKPLLRSCSSQRRLPTDEASFSSHEGFEFQSDGLRAKQKWLESDHGVDVGEVDDDDHDNEFFPRTLWQDVEASVLPFPKHIAKNDMYRDLSFLSRNSKKFLAVGEGFAQESGFTTDPVKQTVGPSNPSLDFEVLPAISDSIFGTEPWDVEPFIDYNALERSNNNDNISVYEYGADKEGNNCLFRSDVQNTSSRRGCFSLSFTNIFPDIKSDNDSEDDISRIPKGHDLPDAFSPKFSDSFTYEPEWLSSVSRSNNSTNKCVPTSHLVAPSIYLDKYENQKGRFIHEEEKYVYKRKRRRSHSAPPVYKGRKKFFALNNQWALESGKTNAPTIHEAPVLEEANDLKHSQQSSVVFRQHSKLSSVGSSPFYVRPDTKEMPDIVDIQGHGVQNKTEGIHIYNVDSVEDFTSEEIRDSLDSELKWGKSYPQIANGGRQLNLNNQDSILDISSGLLHLCGDSLVPETISKHCLEDAKVLQQVDRKFIPVVASGVLAIIDQHAADERIRLEELRQKVLSGEMKAITYLDTEKELALPEIGYQLLHIYAEQIQYWGWLCNIHAHGSKSFKKNLKLLHGQPSNVTLLAVPCILGVNLTDNDLLEFLQQLVDTDGSSTLPPSVLRILNFKACRGAIMFGDALLPSECSLIVEELKQTALCFQCAHGRPTTAPLVNLGALHKQISKLRLLNDCSNEPWHGLQRGELTVKRAAQRLSAAGVKV